MILCREVTQKSLNGQTFVGEIGIWMPGNEEAERVKQLLFEFSDFCQSIEKLFKKAADSVCESAAFILYFRWNLFLDNREIVFAYAAERAHPVIGDVFKGRSGFDATVRIACCRVVNITADIANVLLHNVVVFNCW